MDFRQELRALIDRHITPSTGYDVYYVVQIALQQELKRLDREADKFSDDEMNLAWDHSGGQMVPLDLREL